MTTKFYCNSATCTHREKGPFVFELAQEAVMDGNNLATIFCPRCRKPMRPLITDPDQSGGNNRFFCHNDKCSSDQRGLFFIDLPEEAVMDQNNLATIFCPKCGRKMTPCGKKAPKAVNF